MPKYIQYIRVSTKKQGRSGLGLESQTEILNHYVGNNTIKIFKEIESGANSKRPQLKKAINLCLKHGYGLAVAKVDRLSRNTEFALDIYSQLDGNILSCDIPQQLGSKMDKFTLTIFLAIADREKELISIRTSSALQRKIKRDGKWQKSNKEFKNGNVSKIANKKKTEISKNRENNKKVYETICMYLEKNMSWSAIARKLNESGFKTAYSDEQINNKKMITKGFQAIQVQRIYNKYTK